MKKEISLFDMAIACGDEAKRYREAHEALSKAGYQTGEELQRAEIFELADRFISKCASRQQAIFKVLRRG